MLDYVRARRALSRCAPSIQVEVQARRHGWHAREQVVRIILWLTIAVRVHSCSDARSHALLPCSERGVRSGSCIAVDHFRDVPAEMVYSLYFKVLEYHL